MDLSKAVWLPLQGPTGERPKAPSVSGWQSPSYEGIGADLVNTNDWIGLRCDGLVVVDCDTLDAAVRWKERIGTANTKTWVRKSPRGFHFIYNWASGAPEGPRADVFGNGSHTDIRAGRTSQIVFYAPGYRDLDGQGIDQLRPFDPAWLPSQKQLLDDAEEWEEMPDGRGNNTMAAIAGVLRRQGMSEHMMLRVLAGVNRLTMTRDPMPLEMVASIAHSVARYAPDPDIDVEIEDEEPTFQLESSEPVNQTDVDEEYFDARYMTIPPPAEWLWKPYLPKGRLLMLDGEEGIGKGLFCAWAAQVVASGGQFPEGSPLDPAPVLWYTAEDDPHEDVLVRILAAGYEQKVHQPVFFRNPRKIRLTFPVAIGHLRKLIVGKSPGLVILDPGRSYLAPENPKAVMSYNDEAVLRPGLEALMHLAHDTKTTIIFVHHWNKKSEGTTRDKMGGSAAFIQAVRHRVVLAEVGTTHAFSVEKSNITEKYFSVRSYDIEPAPGHDTALFKVGGPVPEYRSLDQWIDTMKKLESDPEIILADTDWEEAAWHYSYLKEGSIGPTRENLAKDLSLSTDEAAKLMAVLQSHNIIDKNHVWKGQPAANARRRPLDADDD